MAMKIKSEETREKQIRLQQETQRKELAERAKRREQRRALSDRWSVERLIGIKNTRPEWTLPLPPPPEAAEKSQYSDEFYDNQTPEERAAFINEKLTNILGEEKMKEPILPSGHNPMDPVIAEHNQRAATISILNYFDAQRAEVQHQENAQMRLAREEEATRLKTEILYSHYRDIYQGRINKLAMFTGDMLSGIDRLEAAISAMNTWEAANIVHVLTYQVFEPVHGLLQECDNEIPLDLDGTQMLKGAWPMARLQGLFDYLLSKANDLEPEVILMAQGIESIFQRLNNPTPFVNPLTPKPRPFSDFRPNYSSTTANPTVVSAPGAGTCVSGAVPASDGGWSFRGRASTSGVDPGVGDIPGAASGIAKLYAATAENTAAKATGNQIPSVTVEPKDSVARTNVMQYVATDNMVLDSEIQDMFRNVEPKSSHRRTVTDCIKGLVDAANGEEKILDTMDAPHYRSQIEKCVEKIDALPRKYREVKDTKALKKLCGQALKIWSVQT